MSPIQNLNIIPKKRRFSSLNKTKNVQELYQFEKNKILQNLKANTNLLEQLFPKISQEKSTQTERNSSNSQSESTQTTKVKLKFRTKRRVKKLGRRRRRKIRKPKLIYDENSSNIPDKIRDHFRRFILLVAQWSVKILFLLTEAGICIKNNLETLYETFWRWQQTNDHFEELSFQIQKLDVKTREIESEIELLKRGNSLKQNVIEICAPVQQPPPAPPLPPPTLLFSNSTNLNCQNFNLRVLKEHKKFRFDDRRPIITLQDILNVKLKKIA